MTPPRAGDDRGTCRCIAISHDHKAGTCDRTAKVKGGVCGECHYWARNR